MKKWKALLLAVLMVFTFAACGTDETGEVQTSAAPETTAATLDTQPTGETLQIPDGQPTENVAEATVAPTTPPAENPPVTPAPTEAPKSSGQQTHTHTYNSAPWPGSCIQEAYTIYVCRCGDSYKTDYHFEPHNYGDNYICKVCGAEDPNFTLYYAEQRIVTDAFLANEAALQAKIDACYEKIDAAEKAKKAAEAELLVLSPECPQYFIQQYVNHWQDFGSTAAATSAAQQAWSQQYNAKKSQLNNIIASKNREIAAAELELAGYQAQMTSLEDGYRADLKRLKNQYGLR